MHEVDLVLTLETDAIFSKSGGTIGRPESLDHPPGGALLGAVAARLYKQLGPEAFAAFQLGQIRLSDGRPLDGAVAAIPVPLSWHRQKSGAISNDTPKGVFDLSHDRPDGQLVQMREGWLVARGGIWRSLTIDRRTSMRTAIDEGGMAREGLLFGFEAVPAGQRYLVTAAASDGALLESVVTTLCGGCVRLGRSRSAEFGKVSIDRAEPLGAVATPPVEDTVRLLCLSDLALRDPETGQPTTTPTPALLGLKGGWELDLERTFLRTRRYSPWNGHRCRPDLERHVIIAGSVLTLTRNEGIAPDPEWPKRLLGGVGEHVGSGLGRIAVNPPALAARMPELAAVEHTDVATAFALPDDGLGRWLQREVRRAARTDRTWTVAEALAVQARTWGIPASQWGRIRTTAARSRHGDGREGREKLLNDLRDQVGGVTWDLWRRHGRDLFGTRKVERTHSQRDTAGARRESSPQQKATWGDAGKLSEWLNDDQIDFARAIQILGRRAVRTGDAALSKDPGGRS